MATKISSSQNEKHKFETEHLPMPAELLKAATDGNRDLLVRLLGLEEQEAVNDHKITMDPSDSVLGQTEAATNKAEYENLRSVTRFGNTVLHILVINSHNELACMVLKKDMSLLRACNKMLETPLHCALQVGNKDIIIKLNEIAHDEVKYAFRETNSNGETALYVAAKHGQREMVVLLMQLDREMAYRVDKGGLSPLDAAIVGGHPMVALTMLLNDATLGYIQDSNGLFPVHLAASKGPFELVNEIMLLQPDLAKLQDHRGRNIFHIAAEENKVPIITVAFNLMKDGKLNSEMVSSMIKTTDHEGNTPLHIAAKKGHGLVMKTIWERMNQDLEAVKNKEGLTAFELSVFQIFNNNTTEGGIIQKQVPFYLQTKGKRFSREFFEEVFGLELYQEKWERSQIIGLGSVLITTVAFAAAFTIPGGYNADNGKPVLGGRYMFRAFILANTMAFIQAFKSLFTIVSRALMKPKDADLGYAIYTFLSAAGCMVVAFGVGSYVMLAPVSLPIAIIVLAVSLLLGSPAVFCALTMEQVLYSRFVIGSPQDTRHVIIFFLKATFGTNIAPLLLIFCLAFL